ncbi:glycosyltransferase family 2 protein [Geofilum sp. OHC36d9]|uniref:glycosyltransferase family 2 protein n=1 Tax=Geofilum sp. OHC36d9 TaxID=3458413 RepID=UPI0040345BA0
MHIYAIIVTYNGVKWINKCFGSLVNSSIPLKILAIDNGSSDGTPALIKEKFPKVEVIETGQNLGFGKANNIGLKRTLDEKADYAFLLNQDAWVEEDTIEKLIGIHKVNNNYALLAPLQLNGEGLLLDNYFYIYSITPVRELVSDTMLNKQKKKIYKTPFLNGACWLLPLKTITNIGGFDPLFPHYGEDNDYINRIHRQNLEIGICPNTYVYHDREYRKENISKEKYINRTYISLLVDLKKNRYSIIYYYKKLSKTLIRLLLSKRNAQIKLQIKALFKLFKNYKYAKSHCKIEMTKKAHYL